MTTTHAEPTVDINIPRFNQAMVAAFTAVAFVVQRPWLVGLTFAILAISWLGGPTVAPFSQIYVRAFRPRVDANGPTEVEPAAPPRFAQLVGTLFLGAASLSFVAGAMALGWGLTLVVTALAALAATTRICVGCIVYERAVER